jgi:GTP-binding protein HflX
VRLPTGERIGLSDTVGFISDLPTQLVAAFRATLEEVLSAEVIVHVRDIASPATEAQAADVEAVLAELGIDEGEQERRVVELWNKADRLDAPARADAEARLPRERAVLGSARTGEGEEALLALIARRLGRFRTRLRLEVPVADGEAIARAYRLGAVVERRDGEERVTLDLDVPAENLDRLRSFAHERGLTLDVPHPTAAE